LAASSVPPIKPRLSSYPDEQTQFKTTLPQSREVCRTIALVDCFLNEEDEVKGRPIGLPRSGGIGTEGNELCGTEKSVCLDGEMQRHIAE